MSAQGTAPTRPFSSRKQPLFVQRWAKMGRRGLGVGCKVLMPHVSRNGFTLLGAHLWDVFYVYKFNLMVHIIKDLQLGDLFYFLIWYTVTLWI